MPAIDYGLWGSKVGINPGGVPKVGAVLASAATIAPTHPIHHISGTAEITTITLPWTGFIGEITLIADAAFTLATGGNIAVALTAVANQAVDLVFDGTLWYPKMMD